jgi:hypothetical protein
MDLTAAAIGMMTNNATLKSRLVTVLLGSFDGRQDCRRCSEIACLRP